MMGEVASDLDQAERFRTVHEEQVKWLEQQADAITVWLKPHEVS
jgi:hypothetical protein